MEEETQTLTLPSSPLFATQPSTGRASVLLHLHCFKNSDVSTTNWERYLNAVIWILQVFLSTMGRPWVSTSSSSRQNRFLSFNCILLYFFSDYFLTQNGFLVNVRSFFVDFYLCHFLVAEGSFLGETGVPASAGVTRSITTRSFQLVPKPVPSRFQHVCQSLLLLPCGGFVRN